NETVDALFKLNKRTEGNDADDLAVYDIAFGIALSRGVPRTGLELFVADGNFLVFAINLEDLELIALANLKNVRDFLHARPGQIGNVRKAIEAVDGNECTEGGNSLHLALDDVADLNGIEERRFLFCL